MNLVLLVRYLQMGGAERQSVELACAMSGRGHKVTLMTFYPGGELLVEARDRGLTVVDLGRRGWWDFAVFVVRLARQIKRLRPDVLYSSGDIPNLAAVLVRPFISPCKIAWGIRNNMILSSSVWVTKFITLFMPRLSSFADLIIANSHGGRNEALKQGFSTTHFYVLDNCINVDRFVCSDSLRREFRNRMRIGSGDVLIGIVGIRAGKGIGDFLKAAASVASKRQNLKILIVGGDAARSKTLSRSIEKLGLGDKTICLNVTTDIVPIFNALDLLCSASYGEGFPNVIAEAMSCGTPCVVTDVGESAAIVGPHGVVVPPGEPKLLADGLARAVDDLGYFGNQEAIRRRIVEKYSSETVAKRMEELFRKVASSQMPAK